MFLSMVFSSLISTMPEMTRLTRRFGPLLSFCPAPSHFAWERFILLIFHLFFILKYCLFYLSYESGISIYFKCNMIIYLFVYVKNVSGSTVIH